MKFKSFIKSVHSPVFILFVVFLIIGILYFMGVIPESWVYPPYGR